MDGALIPQYRGPRKRGGFQEEDNDFFLINIEFGLLMGHSSGKTRKLHVYVYSLYVDGHMHACVVLEFLRRHRVRDKSQNGD